MGSLLIGLAFSKEQTHLNATDFQFFIGLLGDNNQFSC